MCSRKPILVTGIHRSGSTWVGIIIASGDRIKYILEPFLYKNALKKQIPINNNYEYISERTDHNEQLLKRKIIDLYSFKWDMLFYGVNPLNVRSIRLYLFRMWSSLTYRPLIKDPLAFFSAKWIYQTFNAYVVVIIRHPAAFVASLKMANWPFDFNQFKEQPQLINDYLKEYQDKIMEFSIEDKSIVEQGCLLWNIIYSVALKYEKEYGNSWYFVKHESLSVNPEEEFKKMFKYLDVKYTTRVEDKILETTMSKYNKLHHRDSKQNIQSWKTRLTKDEVEYIKQETYSVWKHFYKEDEWCF